MVRRDNRQAGGGGAADKVGDEEADLDPPTAWGRWGGDLHPYLKHELLRVILINNEQRSATAKRKI